MEDKKTAKNPMLRKFESGNKMKEEVEEVVNPIGKAQEKLDSQSHASSFIKFPTLMDSYDVSLYMNSIEEKLKLKNITYEQRMYLEQFAELLDSLTSNNVKIFLNGKRKKDLIV